MGYYKLYRQAPQGKAIHGILVKCQPSELYARPVEIAVASTLENNDYKIPALVYPVRVTMSPKFGKELPLICNVPNCTGIRIHGGTLPQHSKGCILIPSGLERKYAIRHFSCEQARKEDIRLEIIDFKPGDPAPPSMPDLTKFSSLKNL